MKTFFSLQKLILLLLLIESCFSLLIFDEKTYFNLESYFYFWWKIYFTFLLWWKFTLF